MQRYLWPVVLALTLGLAPFFPEPHLLGKLRWIAGGAVGMTPMDWFDALLHGFPFLWLLGLIAGDVRRWWSDRRTASEAA